MATQKQNTAAYSCKAADLKAKPENQLILWYDMHLAE